MKLQSNTLRRVLITAPDGLSVEARALLDNASSTSFISERLVQSLFLPRISESEFQELGDYPTKLRFSPSPNFRYRQSDLVKKNALMSQRSWFQR